MIFILNVDKDGEHVVMLFALHIVTNIYTIFCHPIRNLEYKIKFPGNIGEGNTMLYCSKRNIDICVSTPKKIYEDRYCKCLPGWVIE